MVQIRNEKLDKIRIFSKKHYPQHNWDGHLMPVVATSLYIANGSDVDKDIVEAGAFLHDIGRVRFGCPYHEKTGAYYSVLWLRLHGFSPSDTSAIAHIIRHHGTKGNPRTLEAEIVRNADAVSHFTRNDYLLEIVQSDSGLDETQANAWLYRKLKADLEFKITLPKAVELVEKTEVYQKLLDTL